MKPDKYDIDAMLGRLSESSPPPAPANVEQNVLRRIHLEAPDSRGWQPTFWPRWLTNPTFGLGLALVSGAIGILSATMVSAGYRTSEGSGGSADPLAVFSTHAPGMLNPGDN